MKNSNSHGLTRTTLAILACSGLAFGCVNNGADDDARRDQSSTTTPDTYSGTTTGMNDTTSGTTAAPATGAATTHTTTTTTAPAAGTTATGTTDAHAGHMDSATTPDAGTKTANAKKKAKKMDKKSDKPAADATKTDSSSNSDLSGSGDLGMYDENENMNDEAGTEVTDPSLASTSNPEEDATVSGMTSSPESNPSSVGTESVSTSSASDEDLKTSARMAGGLSPWATEPYSRIPTHTYSPTGKDKSVSSLERYNVFIDPPALERAIRGRDALRPVTEIDFNSFGYDRRSSFTSQMNSRLANIDSRLDVIEAKVSGDDTAGQQITTIQNDHLALENQLGEVRKVDESQWDSFRDSFRDRLTALEREVARLSVSR